ncbi:MAG: histidine phosphatase family protein [Alphaproteobacteria bacterium]|jgi:broad specificity phosphatase PhoE|nr:histidine phosphatase family protein [Alphaproteobacteria bacterium]MCB9985158.1 histidine phosphatase family protein [Micavibrio sp.]HPQ51407.1 histidine phosphatase family protein [Alphaproteobacteria bacterium]
MIDCILPLKPFYLLRHGESEYNRLEIAAGGGVDTPLTEDGRAQAQALAAVLYHLLVKPSAIYHSHQSRARDTAYIVNEVLGLPIQECPNIHEHEFGDWEGISWPQLQDNFSAGLEPPNGETKNGFAQRVRRGLYPVLEKDHDAPPLIVAHGGVFRAFGLLYGVDLRRIGNCELRLFEPDPSQTRFPWKMRMFKPDGGVLSSSFVS